MALSNKKLKQLSHLHSLPRTKKWRERIGESNKGHFVSKKTRKKIGKANKGNQPAHPFQKGHKICRKKEGYKLTNKFGKDSLHWKGGITPINNQIRGSLEYKLWSDSVWNRDCNCCQKCRNNILEKLVAHHIRNFAQFPELRFAIDNGITFCRRCHVWFHGKYGRKYNTKKQLEEFLKPRCIADLL